MRGRKVTVLKIVAKYDKIPYFSYKTDYFQQQNLLIISFINYTYLYY